MIHEASLKRKQKFEVFKEIDDKIEKNMDDFEIHELDDPDEQYREIDIENGGEAKAKDDISDDTNNPVTEKEEVGENNLLDAETEENGPKENIQQMTVKDINVKTTSKILSLLHKGMLIGSKKESYFCLKVGKEETAVI